MSKVLFWDFEGTLARREPDWRLAAGALDVLDLLAGKGWRHVIIADATPDLTALCDALGLTSKVEAIIGAATLGVAKPDPAFLTGVIAAIEPFDEAFVIGDSVTDDIAAAAQASLPSILVGDAAPQAQFSVEQLSEIPLALETWNSMRRSFLF
jgi:FMN phosphatase YigB (HAD superfamily)